MKDPATNLCYNCLDRHVEAGHGDKTAIIWEGNDPSESKNLAEQHPQIVSELQQLAQQFVWPEKLFSNAIGLPAKAKP